MKDGGSRWLEAIYDEYASRVYGYLLGLTRSETDAEDLLQEVFVRLLLKKVAAERSEISRVTYSGLPII